MIQMHFGIEDWLDLSMEAPEEFIREIERRYPDMPHIFRSFVTLIKNGDKAGKEFSRKSYPSLSSIRPGDWIVRPYQANMVELLKKCVKRGRLGGIEGIENE